MTAVTFSPDGESIISGSTAGIYVRQTDNLSVVRVLATTLEQVNDLRFSTDGEQLAAAGGVPAEMGAVEIFDWPSGNSRQMVHLTEDVFYSVAWLPDNRGWLATGMDGTAWLHHPAGDQFSLTGHSRGVTGVCVLDGTWKDTSGSVVTSSIDQTLRVWDLSKRETVRTLHNHTHAVHTVCQRPHVGNGPPVVASISDDRTVRFWQPTIGRMMRFARIDAVPLCGEWSTDGSLFLTGCSDGRLRVVDPQTAEVVDETPLSTSRLTSLSIHPHQEIVVVGTHSGELLLHSLNSQGR